MPKKSYDVSSSRVGGFSTKRNDSSFSSCLCTMLVILVICSLLLLLSFSFKKFGHGKEYDGKEKTHEKLTRNDDTTGENPMDKKSTENETTQKITTQKEASNSREKTWATHSTVETQAPTSRSSEQETKMTTTQNIPSGKYKINGTTTERGTTGKNYIAKSTTHSTVASEESTLRSSELETKTTQNTQFESNMRDKTTTEKETKEQSISQKEDRSHDETTIITDTPEKSIPKSSEQGTKMETTQNIQSGRNIIDETTTEKGITAEINSQEQESSSHEETWAMNSKVVSEKSVSKSLEIKTSTESKAWRTPEITLSTLGEEDTSTIQSVKGIEETIVTTEEVTSFRNNKTSPTPEISSAIIGDEDTSTIHGVKGIEEPIVTTEEVTSFKNNKTSPTPEITSATIGDEDTSTIQSAKGIEETIVTTKEVTSFKNNKTSPTPEITSATIDDEDTSTIQSVKGIEGTIATTEEVTSFENSTIVTTNKDNSSTSSEEDTRTITPKTSDISQTTRDSNKTKICHSSSCDFRVSRIIASMNLTEKPCNDFYNFACGGFSRENEEQIDIFHSDLMEQESLTFLKDFRRFYNSCRHYEDNFHYRDRLDTFNKILTNEVHRNVESKKNEITDLFANLILLEAFPHLDISIDVNPTNSSTFIIVLMKPKFKPLSRTYWSSFSEYRRRCMRECNEKNSLDGNWIHKEYRDCMSNYSDFLMTTRTMREDRNEFLNVSRTIVDMERSMKNLSSSFEQFGDTFFIPNDYNEETSNQASRTVKIRDIQAELPIFNWTRLFSLMIDDRIEEDTEILIDHRSDFGRLMANLSGVDDTDLMDVLESMVEYSIYENVVLQSHVDSRTEFCKEQTKYLMPDIVNYLYKIASNSKLKENDIYIREMFDRLKNGFNESLENSTWIDDITKTEMQKQLEGIKLFLFETEIHEDERKSLIAMYNETLKEDDYPGNLILLMKQKKRSLLAMQGRDVNPSTVFRYLIGAEDKKPLYFPTNGHTYIPYGLVKKASRELPGYLVLGQVGLPLAKIIGEAFAPIEIQRLIKNDDTTFKFSSFVNYVTDGFSDGVKRNKRHLFMQGSTPLQVNDIIAENTALRLLTDSLEIVGDEPLLHLLSTEFSREQIFFIGVAQEFCTKDNVVDISLESFENNVLLPQIRIEDILRNSKEFSNQFRCPTEPDTIGKQFPYILIYENPIVSS